MNSLALAAREIIKAQEAVIGPIALEQAGRVPGLKVSGSDIKIEGNPGKILDDLVHRYADFFGQASIEVCRDAIREIKPPITDTELPDILK